MVNSGHQFSPKLTPPRRRSDTIRRERLHERLSDSLEYETVVVSAPAGYGKSTLAVDWCDDIGLPTAWLSTDRADTDPLTFVSDLVGAVRVAFPETLQDVATRLDARATPAEAIELIGQFIASVHREIDDLFLLVIDDIHVLDDAPEALAVLDALVSGPPMSMRIYALSRTLPRLPSLARMTAQRRAFSLGAEDLEFTNEEATEFLRRSGIEAGGGQLDVVQRAGGWAAALAILADHYDPSRPRGGTAPGSEFVLSDFIEYEVLGRLPPEQLSILSACSVLDSFDAEFAEALTGDPGAAMHLRELEGTNHLITSLSDNWLRMHALLREHLLDRLARDERDRLLQLRRSAAALSARRGLRREAIELSIDAGDWAEVVRELHDVREELYQRGEWTTLISWLDRLPAEILDDDADLSMTRARLATKMLEGQSGLARLESIKEQELTVDQRARRELYRAASLRQVGRLSDSIAACRRARLVAAEELPDDDSFFPEIDLEEGIALGEAGQFAAASERFQSAADRFDEAADHHRTAEANEQLGNTLFYQGWLSRAMEAYTAALRRWRMLDDSWAQLATTSNIGGIQHALGDLETARDTYTGVIQRAQELGNRRMDAHGQEGLAAVERDLGNLEAAEALYGAALQAAQEIDDPMLVAYSTLGLAHSQRERGQFPRARTLFDHGLRSAEQRDALYLKAAFRSGIGANLLSEHRYEEAIPVLEQAVAEAEETGARREHAVALMLLAGACFHRRKRRDSTEHLKHVHEIVQELGYDQFLYSEARQMPELIEYGAARRVGGDYFRGLRNEIRPPSASGDQATLEDEGAVPAIRAEAFGNPRVTVRGHQIADLEWRSERSKEMFFYLIHHGRALRKEQIALDLWPDLDPKRLNSAFHSTLHRLRKAIDPQVVIHTDDGYQVNPDFEISYDASEFDQHTADAERERAGGGSSAPLAAAISLYRGPFAETFDSDWADEARRRYEDRYLSCLLSLATHALKSGDWDQAIQLGESIWEVDPVNEEAALCVIQAHARSGHLDLATRAYRRLHRAVQDEQGDEPSEALQRVYEQVLSGAALSE